MQLYRFEKKNIKYNLKLKGKNVIIKCSDKGYNTEKKRIISDYFDSFNVDDTDANSS